MSQNPIVLVVDDEPQIRRFLRPSLEAQHYLVFEAGSAADFDAIEHWVKTQITTNEQAVAKLLDLEPDPNAAGAQVRAWMFLERFEQSVRERRDLKLSL